MLIISSLFLVLNHPVSLGLILLSQISFISMNLKFLNSNSWFSYILFIIMVGGLMIIFIYMTSISSNKKFMISNKKIMILLTLIIFSLLAPNNLENKNNEPIKFFLKFIYSNENLIIIMLISYIFIVLIAVSSLTKINQGPMRKI